MIRYIAIAFALLLVFNDQSVAQFTVVSNPVGGGSNFFQMSNGDAAWGDYDADGDLDLAMNGQEGSGVAHLFIYQNNGDGTFSIADADTMANTSLIGLRFSTLSWGDFDNDGDLDLIQNGIDNSVNSSTRTLLYAYTDNGFVAVPNPVDGTDPFPGNDDFTPTWVDYDHDGDLDLYFAGLFFTPSMGSLYNNNGDGTFTLVATPVEGGNEFEGHTDGRAVWGDLNGDQYVDLFSQGITSFNGINSALYTGNGDGTFEMQFRGRDQGSPIITFGGGRIGSTRLVDFDNDGDLDLFFGGESNGNSRFNALYANDGNNGFTFVANIGGGFRGFTGALGYGASWGDYDGDGDSDLAYGGVTGTSRFVDVESNEGNNIFNELINPVDGTDEFTGVFTRSVIFGDYDNDGDLDILVQGEQSGFIANVTLYQNTTNHSNAAPSAPTNMSVVRTSTGVRLFWEASTDDATPSEGLNYNLRIGTTPGGSEITAPMSIVGGENDGQRLIPSRGMIQGTNARMNLPNGTYYWSVQAIDPGHKGSAFSAEQMFEVTDFVAAPPAAFNLLSPADGVEGLGATPSEFTWEPAMDAVDLPEEVSYIFELSDDNAFANKLDSVTVIGDTTYSTIASLDDGTYYWRVSATNSSDLTTWGSESDVTPFTFTIGQAVSTDEGPGGIPTEFSLGQNFPNPFNPTTNISFSLPRASEVSINVFNILGQQVATAFQGNRAAGTHTITFDASSLSSGVYIYQLRAGSFIQTRKLTLLK